MFPRQAGDAMSHFLKNFINLHLFPLIDTMLVAYPEPVAWSISQKVKAMAKKTIKQNSITRLSILNHKGEVDQALEPQLAPQKLKKMFEDMLRMREFDARAIAMQRQGRMGTYAATTGQEATNIGSASALRTQDWAVPSFREQGVYLSRGIPARTLFLFYMGTEEGNRIPKSTHTLPFCIPCASQVLHAVGIGMAANIKKEDCGVVTYFGDGATSEGDLHEAMNFASVFQTPVVFLCQNNQWAISTPLSQQSHSATLAQRALAYDMPGVQVDGNDVLAVYQATHNALNQARGGGGPSFLECINYRICAHTTSDDPSRYRSEEEVKSWQKRDPLNRFEKYLLNKRVLQEGDKERMQKRIAEEMKNQAAEAETIIQRLSPDEIFSYLFQNMPEVLKGAREELLRSVHLEEEGVLHA